MRADRVEGRPVASVRLSPQPAARFIKKYSPELLTVSKPGILFRERGFVPVDEDLWRVDLRLVDGSGAADHANANSCHSDGNRRSDDQLRNAAWHDRLHPRVRGLSLGLVQHAECDGHHTRMRNLRSPHSGTG